MNRSDTERVRTVLHGMGFTETDKEEEATILGVIACSVRQKGIIESVSIASDGLEPELIDETERILSGASIKKAPDCGGNEVAKDILTLIY